MRSENDQTSATAGEQPAVTSDDAGRAMPAYRLWMATLLWIPPAVLENGRKGAAPEARDSRCVLPLSATKLPFDTAPLYGNDAPTDPMGVWLATIAL